jgi:hypothetical protein
MRVLNNKVVVAVATGTLVLGGTGAAYAYWTTSGTGSGSATTAAGAANLVVSDTSALQAMYPGDTAQVLSGTVKNAAANAAYVTKVAVAISGVTKGGVAATGCDASDFTLTAPDMAVGKEVAAGDTVVFSGATIKFNDKNVAQDGCKGVTVALAYTAS